jgi:putative flippase GtrA
MKPSAFIQSLITEKTDHRLIQLFRYGTVTVISSVIDFGILYFLTETFGIHYLVSAVIAYTIGLIVNYALSIIWVFHKKKLKSRVMEFVIFSLIGLLGMGLNELLLWVFTDILQLYFMVSRLISAVIGFGLKYLLRKWILF